MSDCHLRECILNVKKCHVYKKHHADSQEMDKIYVGKVMKNDNHTDIVYKSAPHKIMGNYVAILGKNAILAHFLRMADNFFLLN